MSTSDSLSNMPILNAVPARVWNVVLSLFRNEPGSDKLEPITDVRENPLGSSPSNVVDPVRIADMVAIE